MRKVDESSVSAGQDLLAVEEPLEIQLNGRTVAVTMRTPGADRELAVGFLFTEGILHQPAQIGQITEPAPNVLSVRLAPDSQVDLTRLERHFFLSSSCGVCGKASIQAIEQTGCVAPPRGNPQIEAALVRSLPDLLRATQPAFERTGGLHAAGLFGVDGRKIGVREDVGRHNAVDKLIGTEFLANRLPLNNCVLMLSGRSSFELVQKAVMAGIPIIAAVGAPSSLAVEVALRYGVTLMGFVREGRFNIYSGESRIRQ